MSEEPDRTFDQTILSAWQEQIEATRNPSIKQQCSQRKSELLPRFAEHYQQLRALRRRARRSLQRQWKRSLAGVALLLALGQAPA
jgi:phosphatidylserine/phosphatidylglycerophosphate/cardiolipin synthase-like enzyme